MAEVQTPLTEGNGVPITTHKQIDGYTETGHAAQSIDQRLTVPELNIGGTLCYALLRIEQMQQEHQQNGYSLQFERCVLVHPNICNKDVGIRSFVNVSQKYVHGFPAIHLPKTCALLLRSSIRRSDHGASLFQG